VVLSAVLTAVASGAAVLAGGYLLARLAAAGMQTDRATDEFRTLGLWALGIGLMIALFWLVASIVWFAYAVPDLRAQTQIRGRLLRVREDHDEHGTETWIAVDDGTARSGLRAFLLMSGAPIDLVQGCLVDVTVSPRLGHVSRLERVAEPGSPVPARRSTAPAPNSLSRRLLSAIGNDDDDDASSARESTTPELDLTTIASTTGVQLSLESHQALGGSNDRELWYLGVGTRGRVVLRRDAETSWSENAGCLLGMRGLSRMARRRRTSVPGVGQWAAWSDRRSTLMSFDHGFYVSVSVLLNDVSAETRRQIAIALARQLVSQNKDPRVFPGSA
jgi:hypothetical protein